MFEKILSNKTWCRANQIYLLLMNVSYGSLSIAVHCVTCKVFLLHQQVVLPLLDQYFKNHRLYFLSTAIHPISSGGHASNKEKEMVTR